MIGAAVERGDAQGFPPPAGAFFARFASLGGMPGRPPARSCGSAPISKRRAARHDDVLAAVEDLIGDLARLRDDRAQVQRLLRVVATRVFNRTAKASLDGRASPDRDAGLRRLLVEARGKQENGHGKSFSGIAWSDGLFAAGAPVSGSGGPAHPAP